MSRFQRNILYFAIITVLLVIFYLLPSETKAGTSNNEVDYSNVEVVQETAKYEKVRSVSKKALESVYENIKFSFISQAVDEVVVDNEEQAAGPGEVIEEPEFQPEINQVDDDQIGEPPQPRPNILKFSGRS